MENTKSSKFEVLQNSILRLWILIALSCGSQAIATPNRCVEFFKVQARSNSQTIISMTEILRQLSDNAGQKNRNNPKLVDIRALKIGQEIFVAPIAFDGYPSLSKKIKEPIRMKVVQISSQSKNRNWRRQSMVVYLESPETGRLGIEAFRLWRDIYSQKDYSQYAPFVAGEYVEIGSDYSNNQVYKVLANPESTFTFSGETAVYIGKFIRVYDENNYVVQVKAVNLDIPSTEIIVPRYLTHGLTSGTVARFQNTVKDLLLIPLTFKAGELIRFRNAEGLIMLGTFVRSNARYATVQDNLGRVTYVSLESVFRYLGGEPHTAIYNADWIQAHFHKPSGLVRQFLDAAGKLTSLPDFAGLSVENKILTLMEYLKTNVTWTKGASLGEMAGLRDFNEILCAGAGVCRHLSVLLATMLSELGYNPRVTKYIDTEKKEGHAWLEVDVRMSDGRVNTLVVDPSGRDNPSGSDFVKSFGEVSEEATKNRKSPEALWYTKPGREFLIVHPN